MSLPVCKLFRSALVCNDVNEYHKIRSACGKNYDFLFEVEDKEDKIICCHNVGIVVRCSYGHHQFYYTADIGMFAHTKPYVKCKICGDIIFLYDKELCCVSRHSNCKH